MNSAAEAASAVSAVLEFSQRKGNRYGKRPRCGAGQEKADG